MSDKQLAIVAGAGPGLGHSLMRCFEAHGLKTVGLSRSGKGDGKLDIRTCDLTDFDNLHDVLTPLMQEYGPPKLVVHNPAHLVIRPFLEMSAQDFRNCWNAMAFSAAVLGHVVLKPMARAGEGTFIVSGATASIRGGAKFAAFASAKFALRGLTQSLAREFQPQGVHVVHTLLDGIIDTENSRELHELDPARMIKPDELAEAYWQLSQQPQSVWSHEVDFRPMTERF